VQGRLLARVFCGWSEALFSKVIHTPNAFSVGEIGQIKAGKPPPSLGDRWLKCLDLALRRVTGQSDIPNKGQRIQRLINEYVVVPSLLRNKLAHGQWAIALNRETTGVNADLTTQLEKLDPVVVDGWFTAHLHLSRIVEDLIESPNKAFRRDYWVHLTNLENLLHETQGWSLASKISRLQLKAIPKR
jgi:hypothetical protein